MGIFALICLFLRVHITAPQLKVHIIPLALPKTQRGYVTGWHWLSRDHALFVLEFYRGSGTQELSTWTWNRKTKRSRQFTRTWRRVGWSYGHITPSPNRKWFLSDEFHGGSEVFDRSGNALAIDGFGSKYIFGRWFEDSLRWTDYYVPLHRDVFARIASVKSHKSYVLVSDLKAHPIVNSKTQAIQGRGHSIFVLDLERWVARDATQQDGEPITHAYVSQWHLENRYGVAKDLRNHATRYVSYHGRESVSFPNPLCVKFAEFSPDARRIAWVLYEPKLPHTKSNNRMMLIGVSGKGIQGIQVLGKWGASTSDTNTVCWTPKGDGFSFDLLGKMYFVELNE